MRIERSWEIESDKFRKIQIKEYIHQGVRHPLNPPLEISSLTLIERNAENDDYEGNFKIEDDSNLLSNLSRKSIVIRLDFPEGETPLFREFECLLLGPSDNRWMITGHRIDAINYDAFINIKKNEWCIVSDDYPREIRLNGKKLTNETPITVLLSSLTLTIVNDGGIERSTCTFITQDAHFNRVNTNSNFSIVFNTIVGTAPPFTTLDQCIKEEHTGRYKVGNVVWA